jgi:hypothetical protein
MRVMRSALAICALVIGSSCSSGPPEPDALLVVLSDMRARHSAGWTVTVDSLFSTSSGDSVYLDSGTLRALRAGGFATGSYRDLQECMKRVSALPPAADMILELMVIKQTSGTLVIDIDYTSELKALRSGGCGPPAFSRWMVSGGYRYALRKIAGRWEVISRTTTWIT